MISGDSMYNAVWRLEKGSKPQALANNFHAHWTTRGLDGQVYSESFQEMGGARRITGRLTKHFIFQTAITFGAWGAMV